MSNAGSSVVTLVFATMCAALWPGCSVPITGTDAGGAPDTPADAPTSMIDAGPISMIDAGPGGVDAGGSDAGADEDAGSSGTDAGPAGTDAGPSGIDAGPAGTDAGPSGTDAGPSGTDAGPGTDGGPPVDGGGPCSGAPFSTFYRDLDGDGYGALASGTMLRCDPGGGYVATDDDCDDTRGDVSPAGTETCDGVDENCDGAIDEGTSGLCTFDHGVGACVSGACALVSCAVGYGDCDFVASTGCETDTTSAWQHCGGCGVECSAGLECVGSACMDSPFVRVEAAFQQTCALRANGRLVCWGFNNSSGVADPSSGADTVPPTVVRELVGVVDFDVGTYNACAVLADGSVWCWGQNGPVLGTTPGPVGGWSLARRPSPVVGISGAVSVAVLHAGTSSQMTACATLSNGSVMCWGEGAVFGDGATASVVRATPALVPGLAAAASIRSAGTGGTRRGFCVLRTTGRVTCWGTQGGICGVSSCTNTPVNANGITSATALEDLGERGLCARQGGSWWCWGDLMSQSTGLNLAGSDPIDYTSAAIVGGGGGENVLCTGDPTVACWGASYGISGASLGRGPVADGRYGIADVLGPLAATDLSGSGTGHVCAVSTDGSLWCWGQNDYRSLGDGTTTYRWSPVRVVIP